MKRWICLLAALALLLGLTGAATAETVFQSSCDTLLGAVAEAFELEYTVTEGDSGLTLASMTFDYDSDTITARDASFQGVMTNVGNVHSLAALYQTLKLYAELRSAALEDSDDFVILMVFDDSDADQTITVNADNRVDMMDKVRQLLIKAGYAEDAKLFSDAGDQKDDVTGDGAKEAAASIAEGALDDKDAADAPTDTIDTVEESAAEKPKTVAAEESAQPAAVSEYADARDGLQWLHYDLKLTEAYLVTGDKLQELRANMDDPDACYLTLSFDSPEEDLLENDLSNDSPYIHLLRLCDRAGNLYRYYVLTVNFQGLEEGHSSDEYASSFSLTFKVDADAQPEDFVLYVAGLTDPEFYTYGATFSVPARQLECEGDTLWLAGYDDGAGLDWEEGDLEEDEKPLCLYLVAGDEQLINPGETVANLKLVDAQGNQLGLRRRLTYKRDSFEKNGYTMETGYYIVFYIPKDSDFSDYSLTVLNEAEDLAVPVVAQ